MIAPETAGWLLCNARVRALVKDGCGDVVSVPPIHREPPAWMPASQGEGGHSAA